MLLFGAFFRNQLGQSSKGETQLLVVGKHTPAAFLGSKTRTWQLAYNCRGSGKFIVCFLITVTCEATQKNVLVPEVYGRCRKTDGGLARGLEGYSKRVTIRMDVREAP